MHVKVLVGILLFLCTAPVAAAEKTKMVSEQEKFSYAIGYQLAQMLKQQGFQVDVDAMLQGLRDDLTGIPPRLPMDEMLAVVAVYQQKIAAEREKILRELAQKNQQVGDAFLADNKKKEGVIELGNGLQYKIMRMGQGNTPSSKDTVVVHYRGYLITGEEFDNSYSSGRPATFALDSVIAGWQQVLQLMTEGAKWKVFVPPKLAYGPKGAGRQIGPNETLIFEIELVEVKKE